MMGTVLRTNIKRIMGVALRAGARIPVAQLYCAPALVAKQRGFYMPGELIRFAHRSGFTVISPHSTYVARGAKIGKGTVIHPGVTLEKLTANGEIVIGKNNQLFSSLTIRVNISASIKIGDNNELGDKGGLIATYLGGEEDGDVVIGNNTRLTRSFEVLGNTTIGDGAQILGQAIVKGSDLGAGKSHEFKADPDDPQGAVVKDRARVSFCILEPGSVVHPDAILNNVLVKRNAHIQPGARAQDQTLEA
ncbi:MAG: hypothetical protein HQ596_01525 [Candidatus Saganbacteria bacterium]|nr:hypothetical protein [Candidatus Saganbacteria bacterium]